MNKPIIEARGLAKRYQLGIFGARSLRDEAQALWKRLQRRQALSESSGVGLREFWALKDVSFSVQPGEVLGVIGRNGAGKSTLLKILSRITEPTEGEVIMRGRVASLLEVGTGFHPELSGRDNIYLNGAILGMKRHEINAKFGEIVDFAEVGAFVDTPVKRYSSGMYVRLAFAVAAHLEPEILIVDEVLAVGDQAFQEKCIGKMRDVSRAHGRTVIFVSHNLAAVAALTQRGLYLKDGRAVEIGTTDKILNRYLSDNFRRDAEWTATVLTSHPLQIIGVSVGSSDSVSSEIDASDDVTLTIQYTVREILRDGLIEAYIFAADGTHLITLGEHDANSSLLAGRKPGFYRTKVRIPGNLLNLGQYYVRVNAARGALQTYDFEDTVSFSIVETRSRTAREGRKGHLVPLLPWATEPFEDKPCEYPEVLDISRR